MVVGSRMWLPQLFLWPPQPADVAACRCFYLPLLQSVCGFQKIVVFRIRDVSLQRKSIWRLQVFTVDGLFKNECWIFWLRIKTGVCDHESRGTEVRIWPQVSLCGICGGQTDNGIDIFLFSSVSIIPPMFHTHLFTYHWRYIIISIGSVV
jgi:hypothetical protein